MGADEAEHWLGEETLAGWRLNSKAIHEKVATVRMWFSVWLTSGVAAA